MNVYQIALPTSFERPNFQNSLDRKIKASEWVEQALALAGGYTDLGERMGAWKDDTGKVHVEVMHWYEVACDEPIWGVLVAAAFHFFPDQLAIYTAQVGTCEIILRRAPLCGRTRGHQQGDMP